MSDLLTRFSIDGADRLALRFPAGALKGAGATLSAAMGEEGWLVDGTAVTPWRFESIVQEGDAAFLVGPNASGVDTVASLDDPVGIEAGFPRLLALAQALSVLQAEGRLPRGIVSSGILFAEDGALLVMPPIAVAKALSARGEQARTAVVARLTSPRSSSAEGDVSFLLAQASYRFAAGKGPFERDAADPRGVASAAPVAIATGLAAPRLDPNLTALVDRALADPEGVPLRAWVAALAAARAAGWQRELPPAEEAEVVRRRDALEARTAAQRRRADFLRRRGGILIAVAAALVVLAFVAADMIRAQKDKPDFSQLSPRELVQRYYQAIDGLDLESLEACGSAKALKNDQNYLLNLVVITRTRTAYERKSPIVRAADWLASGKAALASGDLLYGIVDLSLSGGEAWMKADKLAIHVEYTFWSLGRKDDASGDPGASLSFPLEEKRVDELQLERGKKGGWQIVGLDRKTLF